MRILNTYQMKYITTLSSDEKNKLFEIFNQCLHTINEIVIDYPNTWEPPKEHGLRNSNTIIPGYYNNPKIDYFNLDYFKIIKHDVRNMCILNTYQMKYIATLSSDEKNELFEIFNQCIYTINDVLLR